jgi:hypothetical protein
MSASAGAHISVKGTLNLNTGTFGSPTWAAVGLASDMTIDPKWDSGEASIRGSRLKQYMKTMLELGFKAKVRVDYADTNFATLFQAAMTDNIVNALVIDGKMTDVGAFGFWVDFQIFSNTEDLPLNGVNFMEFEFKPTPSVNQQAWVIMGAASAPTSTSF